MSAPTLQQQAILRKAVGAEARSLVACLAGANALRRDQLALLGFNAYAIAAQAARVPENEVLVSHVEEIRRLKRVARRKRRAKPEPDAPPADVSARRQRGVTRDGLKPVLRFTFR